jgi:hypothetical protein
MRDVWREGANLLRNPSSAEGIISSKRGGIRLLPEIADAFVVNGEKADFMALLTQHGGFLSDDRVFSSALLIGVMNDKDSHDLTGG